MADKNTNPLAEYYNTAATTPKAEQNPLAEYYNNQPSQNSQPGMLSRLNSFLSTQKDDEDPENKAMMDTIGNIRSGISTVSNLPATAIKNFLPKGPDVTINQGQAMDFIPPHSPLGVLARYFKQTNPEKVTMSANEIAGKIANVAAPAAVSKYGGAALDWLGGKLQKVPYNQFNAVSELGGGGPVDQVFGEEGFVPKDYMEMARNRNQLVKEEYPSAMKQIAQKVKDAKIQMQPPESLFEPVQAHINRLKSDRTTVDIGNVLQEDLNDKISKLKGIDAVPAVPETVEPQIDFVRRAGTKTPIQYENQAAQDTSGGLISVAPPVKKLDFLDRPGEMVPIQWEKKIPGKPGVPAQPQGDFNSYGNVKSDVSAELGTPNFGIVQKHGDKVDQYNKMVGGLLREARANAAEAAEPGLGIKTLDIGNNQQTLELIKNKIKQKAIAESGSPSISLYRNLQKMIDKPGMFIKTGIKISETGQALKSPWEILNGMPSKFRGE